ncbi:hypothetical protein PR048_020503 [Dryococelus australis]|uniref:Transposable element P transposase n=1 Tax=Dryococelus australis TaxID=614101 RepID=A0ABQ9H6I5_9NEOP|nr:hypothetical protein PR048_020503 [Dryococelus australis]
MSAYSVATCRNISGRCDTCKRQDKFSPSSDHFVSEDFEQAELTCQKRICQRMEPEIMLLNVKVSELENEIKQRQESENRLKYESKMLKQQLLKIKTLHKRCPKLNFFTPKQTDRFLTRKKCRWVAVRSATRKAYWTLPLSTFRKWTRNLRCRPVIQTEVLAVLEATSKIIERLTILSFDEMNMDSRLCYDQSEDKILGPNRNVQVIMARGLASKWKQPIFHDFDKNLQKSCFSK